MSLTLVFLCQLMLPRQPLFVGSLCMIEFRHRTEFRWHLPDGTAYSKQSSVCGSLGTGWSSAWKSARDTALWAIVMFALHQVAYEVTWFWKQAVCIADCLLFAENSFVNFMTIANFLSKAKCRLAYGPADTLPLTVSCFSKIQIGFTFLVPSHLGSPGQRAIKRVCVCVIFLDWLIISYYDSSTETAL